MGRDKRRGAFGLALLGACGSHDTDISGRDGISRPDPDTDSGARTPDYHHIGRAGDESVAAIRS